MMNIRASIAEPRDEAVPRGTLRQQVMIRVLTAIFEGNFRAGEHLVVHRLAEQYQVSPTPVREALVELAGFGMMKLLPNRGAVVLPFGPQQAREISQVRRVLEVEAARDACSRVDAGELAALEAELTRLEALPLDRHRDHASRVADTRLHGLIAASCGSTRLASEIDRYLLLSRTLRDVMHRRDAPTNYSRSDDILEHLAIVRALKVGDAEEAARAMDRHIRATADRFEEVLFAERPAPSPSEG
jgi:DNA-binding GntR family transcriptional regulator